MLKYAILTGLMIGTLFSAELTLTAALTVRQPIVVIPVATDTTSTLQPAQSAQDLQSTVSPQVTAPASTVQSTVPATSLQ